MASVTQQIPNYLGGVSNQPDNKKLLGQLTACTNAYPDPTFGLTKRPGFKFMAQLANATTGGTAYSGTSLDNAKWFYINRDADERYIGAIVGSATASDIHIWNAIPDGNGDNVKCAVTIAASTHTITGNGGSGGTNGSYTNVATTTGGSGTGMTVNVTVSGNVVTAVTVHTEGSGYLVDDVITIAKANIGTTASDATTKIATISPRQYLNSTDPNYYHFRTVQDSSFITNKTRVVTTVPGDAHVENKVATIRIHSVEYSAKYEIKIKIGSGTAHTVTYNARSRDTAANDAATTNTDGDPFLNANMILTALRTSILAVSDLSSMTVTVVDTTLEISHSAAFSCQAYGGKGGTALTVYQEEVDTITELANNTLHGRNIKILNTSAGAGTYYAQFKAGNGVSGPGVWEEQLKPGEEKGLSSVTMPHKLYNSAKNAFTFEAIEFSVSDGGAAKVFGVPRGVGDDDSNSHPSFVGQTIKNLFYYNNRLGCLTADNVSMSQSGQFFNFYHVTAQTLTDADPIDISCSSTRPATLHGIIPTAAGLILFSQNQQFLMFSTEGNLTPTTTLIRGISNYKMDTDILPVDVGTYINFVSKTHDTAGFTRIFAMLPKAPGQAPTVVDIGRIVSEYVPATIEHLTASPQNSFIAMYGKTLDKIYFYRTYGDGEKDLMQTWFDWQCPGNVHYVTTDSDTLYTVIKTGSGADARYNLCSATMTQTPEETIIVTAEGQQVNPHMDFYKATTAVSQYPLESVTITNEGSGYSGTPTVTIAAPASGTQATGTAVVAGNKVTGITITNPGKGYDPANPPAVTFSGGGGSNAAGTAVIYDGSYCKLPFSNLTDLEPVIIIAGNATSNFSGTTESGFTITPGRVTVNSINYFKVPSKDLSGQAANVYVGYKYKYDITLPTTYYQLDPTGKKSDYTASLTIARMKFAIGLSSVVGFKLKRKGVQAATQTFTGDGTNKIFSPDFDVIDKADVIVKKNGAKQILGTDYTIADHASLDGNITVTFTNAPAAATISANVTTPADTVEIYIDNWYTLQPTQEANYYLGDDVPLDPSTVFTVPVHQKNDNFTLRVFSDSPFPVALTSMSWEGTYSPRYYRRT